MTSRKTPGTTGKGLVHKAPPRGIGRLLVRGPIWLYRAGLGGLLGRRFLLLTHRGRKSGQARQTVLEVVAHERAADTYIIASGWGEQADWFQNIRQTPQVRVTVGRRRWRARAERLSVEAAMAVLADYAHQHPVAFRGLASAMVGRQITADPAGYRAMAETIPLVALHRAR